MKITHEPARNRFVANADDGEPMGQIEYMKGGSNELFATHTEVFAKFEGQGVAKQLLDRLAAYAKENSFKIVPICGYVVASFQKHPQEYADVMK